MQKRILILFSIPLLLLLLFAGCSQKDDFPTGDSREELLKHTELPTPTSIPSPTPKTTVLRDYTGWDMNRAAAELESLNMGLQISYEEMEYIGAVSASNPDLVIGQTPQPGVTLHEGDAVTLFHQKPTPTAPPVTAAPIDEKGYSAEEIISYFLETVMHSEYYEGDEPELLRKWEIPILLYVEGDTTLEDMNLIILLINALNEIPGYPGIQLLDNAEEANLIVRFLPGDEYIEYALERIGDENTDGYATGWYSDYSYFEGEVGICSDIDRETKNSVILEEIIQCMGIFNDSYTYPDSLFYQGFNTPQWPTDMDWLMVQLLYREELEPGMTEEEVTAVLRGLLEK